MRVIRNGLFETNSSSVHTLTVCSDKDYQKFIKGEMYYDLYEKILVDEEKANEIVAKRFNRSNPDKTYTDDMFDSVRRRYEFVTKDELHDYISDCDYDWYKNSHKIEGIDVVTFGYYGDNN